jgi:hypothetical protein
MQDNQKLTWKYRFARMKKHYGFSYEQMAYLLGVKADSIGSSVTQKDEKFPNAWKWGVIVFEIENKLMNLDEVALPMNENPYFE